MQLGSAVERDEVDTDKGSDSSLMLISRSASRASIARRVLSDSAEKIRLRSFSLKLALLVLIDVALRTGYVKDSRLVARRLSPMDFLICASPHYLEAQGTPRCAEDFHQHQWIGFRIKETQQLQPIFLPDDKGEYIPYELERSHITDDGEAMAYMCADGLGFAQLPHFLAKASLNSGALVSLYPCFRPPQPESGVFAIYPKRDYLPARVRVFIEFLTICLADMGESANRTWAEDWVPIIDFSRQKTGKLSVKAPKPFL